MNAEGDAFDAMGSNLVARPVIAVIAPANNPELTLQNPEAFGLFRYYIVNLASWYDLNDRKRHFTDLVPIKARQSPLLLSAILAFSAASKHTMSMSEVSSTEVADFYHLQSVRILLQVTSTFQDVISNGEVLAAICLLRSFEILTQNHKSQSHLQGCYSLLASHPINIHSETGLVRAAFWNYLREDITVALIEKRQLMLDLSEDHLPKDLEHDDDYANYITVLLGQVINRGFSSDSDSLRAPTYHALENALDGWKNGLPDSFAPIEVNLTNSTQGVFPFRATLHDWHVAAWQYYYTAMSILLLVSPSAHERTAIEKINEVANLTRNLENHASEICALALASESSGVWVNSFGPIAFCGCWLRDQNKLREVIRGVEHWGARTGWPVVDIVKCLREGTGVLHGDEHKSNNMGDRVIRRESQ
ncbi:hypothetical protein N7456_005487 [Penicillium angulare]|uniref:Transcription factor n=1 Tax=Penicillium angulare TaxID=116970 RepID=A0A9W9KKL0_9EURO|nr:hypothetical protein N7456_005487 [Penicillium angulare]